jgi:hypothetical protein
MQAAGVLVVLRLVYDPVRRRAEPSPTPLEGEAGSGLDQPTVQARLPAEGELRLGNEETHSLEPTSPRAKGCLRR